MFLKTSGVELGGHGAPGSQNQMCREPKAGLAHHLLAELGLVRVSTLLRSAGVKRQTGAKWESPRRPACTRDGQLRCPSWTSRRVTVGPASPSACAPGSGRLPTLPCSPALEAVSSVVPARKATGTSVIHSAPAAAGGQPPLIRQAFLQPRLGTGRPQASAPSGGLSLEPLPHSGHTATFCAHSVTQRVGLSLTRWGKQG